MADDTDTPSAGRSPKWEARRALIVDTSAHLFAKQGYHATGIAELCEANELGKGALYHYIGSKESLLAAIHDRVMDEVLASGARVEAMDGTPTERLVALGTELLEIITRFPDHVWVFLHEFPSLTGERATQFRTRRLAYERTVESVLRAGVDAGEFRPMDARLTARAWLGLHNYTYLWLRPGGDLSSTDVSDWFAQIFLHGITAD